LRSCGSTTAALAIASGGGAQFILQKFDDQHFAGNFVVRLTYVGG
jgi:hypothetical protein